MINEHAVDGYGIVEAGFRRLDTCQGTEKVRSVIKITRSCVAGMGIGPVVADSVVLSDAIATEAFRDWFAVHDGIALEVMGRGNGVEQVNNGLLAPDSFVRVPTQHGRSGKKAAGVPEVLFTLGINSTLFVGGRGWDIEKAVRLMNEHCSDEFPILGCKLIPF